MAQEQTCSEKKKNVVIIGGGTGLSVLIRGIKKLPINLTAIVTMSDDGASSGRIRRAYGGLPPGDVRQCLVAMASDEEQLTKLFNYRFKMGRGLSGHCFGNLFLLALADVTGNFELAVRESSRILNISGKVVPSTLANVNLAAKLQNGQIALGESDIPVLGHRSKIVKTFLIPNRVKANPEAIESIKKADLVLIGPGSLYTSIIPNFLIGGIIKALQENKCRKIYICNISTERGETEHYSVENHMEAIERHAKGRIITDCIVNNNILSANGHEGKLGSIKNITSSKDKYGEIKIHHANIINAERPLFHDMKKLGRVVERFL